MMRLTEGILRLHTFWAAVKTPSEKAALELYGLTDAEIKIVERGN